MGEIERLHQARLAREASARNRQDKPKEHPDPAEWQPKGDLDHFREQTTVSAETVRSEPLNYQTLADMGPLQIAGIEARARADLVRAMDQRGMTVDERGVRIHWQLVAEGSAFRIPKGFIHPEAPAEIRAEGRKAWKRCVEMATDSFSRVIFLAVWRRRPERALPAPEPKAIERKSTEDYIEEYERRNGMEIVATSDDDVVDAEIVED